MSDDGNAPRPTYKPDPRVRPYLAELQKTTGFQDAVRRATEATQASLRTQLQPVIEQINSMRPVLDAYKEAAKTIARIGDFVRKRWPPNWPDDIGNLDSFESVCGEGIPLVYVPRADIVRKLVTAASYDERVDILVAHRAEILEDCRTELRTAVINSEVAEQLALVQEAVDVLDADFHAAAQSLAIIIVDTLMMRAMPGTYKKRKTQAASTDLAEAFNSNFYRVALAVRPLEQLLT